MYIIEDECFLGMTKLIEKSVPIDKVSEKVREYVKEHYVGLGLYHKLTIDEEQNRVVYDFGSHYDFIIVKPKNFKVDNTEIGKFI